MKKYIPELDGFRGVLTFLVFAAHYGFINFGWIAMQAFFVLSGYLISKILLELKDTQGSIFVKFSIYWKRRTLRVFPLYYSLLIIMGIIYIFKGYPCNYFSKLSYLSTFTYNIHLSSLFTNYVHPQSIDPIKEGTGHLWSLSLEEQWYLFLPLVIFTANLNFLKFLSVLFIFSGLIFRIVLANYSSSDANYMGASIYFFSLSHIDSFFVGVAINVFNLTAIKNSKIYLLIMSFLVFIVGLINFLSNPKINKSLIDYFQNLGYKIFDTVNYQHLWSYSLWNLFFGSLIVFLVINSPRPLGLLNKFFRLPILTAPGKVSYGMYLFHYSLMDLFFKVFNMVRPFERNDFLFHVLMFIVYYFFVYLVALFSYKFFELKLLKFKPAYLN